jgi:hypothetical protein
LNAYKTSVRKKNWLCASTSSLFGFKERASKGHFADYGQSEHQRKVSHYSESGTDKPAKYLTHTKHSMMRNANYCANNRRCYTGQFKDIQG